jgi:hypothetical protein
MLANLDLHIGDVVFNKDNSVIAIITGIYGELFTAIHLHHYDPTMVGRPWRLHPSHAKANFWWETDKKCPFGT